MRENNNRRQRNYKKAPKGGELKPVAVNDKFAHIEAVQAQPLEVKVYNNNFDKALRAFRALVQKERILSIYKERQSFEKPSDKRRRKRNEMKRKRQEMSNTSFGERSGGSARKGKSFKPRSPKSSGSSE
jgi:small subunit ribosomal protein S21